MKDTVLAAAEERWLPVVGYEGLYEVSDWGRVKSLERLVKHSREGHQLLSSRVLRPACNIRSGYPYADLRENGKRRAIPVHRLVLEAFVSLRPEGMECCHNDGNPANNRLENLRWDTRHSNHADKLRHGTHNRGENHCRSKLNANQVLAIRADPRLQREIAVDHGICQGTVSQIKRRERWAWLEGPAKSA